MKTNRVGALNMTKQSDECVSSTEADAVAAENLNHVYAGYPTYQEWADFPVQEKDIVDQVQENLRVLEDLYARTSFVSREVHSVLKVRSDS